MRKDVRAFLNLDENSIELDNLPKDFYTAKIGDPYIHTIYIEDLKKKVPRGNWNLMLTNLSAGKELFNDVLKTIGF